MYIKSTSQEGKNFFLPSQTTNKKQARYQFGDLG